MKKLDHNRGPSDPQNQCRFLVPRKGEAGDLFLDQTGAQYDAIHFNEDSGIPQEKRERTLKIVANLPIGRGRKKGDAPKRENGVCEKFGWNSVELAPPDLD